MKRHTWILGILLSSLIVFVFFYKTIIFGLIPFPGDVLLAEYKPWSTYSFDGYNPGSIPNKAQYPDTVRQLYPWKSLVLDSIKMGQLPLWNPFNFSGTPLLANFQSAAFYPLNLIYFFVPQVWGWTLLIILQSFLSIWFTYLYLKKLKVSTFASIFGGTTFGFSLFSTVWIEYNTIGHVILWLPLTLLAIESLKEKYSWRWMAGLIFAQVSLLLAGHPQIAFYSIIFFLVYTWIRAKHIFHHVLTSFLLSAGIGAIQLLPGIELIVYSARSSHDFTFFFQKILIQPSQTLFSIIPNLFGHPATRTYWPMDTYIGKASYVGIVPLFFILSSLRKKDLLVSFLFGCSLFVIILMTANPISYLLYKLNIPILSSSSPTLMMFIVSFALSILTALGLDYWTSEKYSLKRLTKRTIAVIGFFAVIWIACSYLLDPPDKETAYRALTYSGALAVGTLIVFAITIIKPKFMKYAVLMFLCIHATDLFIQFHKFNPFVPTEYVFPPTPITEFLQNQREYYRFWGIGSGQFTSNVSSQLKLYSPEGYDPLYPKWYGEFIGASQTGQIPKQFDRNTRSDAFLTQTSGNDLTTNIFRLKMLDMLGVKYILDRSENANDQKAFPPTRFSKIYEKNNWNIYENKNVLPKFILVSNYSVASTTDEFEKIFFDPAFDVSQKVVLHQPLSQTLDTPKEQDTLFIDSYTANTITLAIKTDGNRLLFSPDTYYPGWTAFVDNNKTEILRTNYAFRSIIVPPGEHKVRFQYNPKSFTIGLTISAISLVLTVLLLTRKSQVT